MAKKSKDPDPIVGNWTVRMKCTVTKVVTLQGCTEEQAYEDPWQFAVDEQETSQDDWHVLSVEQEPVEQT